MWHPTLHTGPEVWKATTDPAIARLRTLRPNRNKLGDSGALSVAMSPHLAALRRLELRGNEITGVGALVLADSPNLSGLAVLDLQGNPILPAAAARLLARFGSVVRLSS